MPKPYSDACDRNRDPILHYLQNWLAKTDHVLEIGSGTGQHAVYFAQHLPQLIWQPSDRAVNIAGIEQWRKESNLANLLAPLTLDVTDSWPVQNVPAIFTANTLHIMSWAMVEAFFAGVARHLQPDGQLIAYGPFNHNGHYTSDSNAQFDQWLKQRDAASGIRDDAAIHTLAEKAGLTALDDCSLPANNRLLRWRKH